MKVKILRRDLTRFISKIKGFSAKKQDSIASRIFIRTSQNGEAELICTRLYSYIRMNVGAEFDVPQVQFSINIEMLKKILRHCENSFITFTYPFRFQDNRIKIESGELSYEIEEQQKEDHWIDNIKVFECDRRLPLNAIGVFSILSGTWSTDDLRQSINCIHFENNTAMSTNGFSAGIMPFPLEGINASIHRKDIEGIMSAFDSRHGIYYGLEDGRIGLKVGNLFMSVFLSHDKFPPFDFFNKPFDCSLSFAVGDIYKTFESAKIVIKKRYERAVHVKVHSTGQVLLSVDDEGNGAYSNSINGSNISGTKDLTNPFEIGLNAYLLTDMLKGFSPWSRISLSFAKSTSPIKIRCDAKDYTGYLMPMHMS